MRICQKLMRYLFIFMWNFRRQWTFRRHHDATICWRSRT
jgi:hypothetical protein